MHLKFLHHGTGDPHKAVSYLLSDKDHNGVERPEVRVLRGNPLLLASLVASLRTVHRYSSAVIAWAPGDQPTPGEVDQVLDDFERLAFSGLQPDQYCHTVVSHGSHVHILVARVELRSGQAMNIAPPPWRGHFDHLRDHWNHRMGWARPDDPNRARPIELDAARSRNEGQALLEAEQASEETGFSVADLLHSIGVEPGPKAVIADHLLGLVCDGQVKNRADVLAALAPYGTIHRAGKDYISIKMASAERPLRFRGAIFHQDFDGAVMLSRGALRPPGGRSAPDLVAAEVARRAMADAMLARAAYNIRRFPAPKPKPSRVVMERKAEDLPVQPPPLEQEDERNRNAVIAAIRAVRRAVQGFVRTCEEAVRRLGFAEHALASAQRAGLAAAGGSINVESANGGVDKVTVVGNADRRDVARRRSAP